MQPLQPGPDIPASSIPAPTGPATPVSASPAPPAAAAAAGAPAPAPPGPGAPGPAEARLPAPVRRYIAALNAADPDAVAGCVTDDFVNEHASPRGRGCRGRAAYRERLPAFLAGFPGLRYELDGPPLTDGDRVAVPYLMTALVRGQPIRVRGLWMLTIRDGFIASRMDYWDSSGVPGAD